MAHSKSRAGKQAPGNLRAPHQPSESIEHKEESVTPLGEKELEILASKIVEAALTGAQEPARGGSAFIDALLNSGAFRRAGSADEPHLLDVFIRSFLERGEWVSWLYRESQLLHLHASLWKSSASSTLQTPSSHEAEEAEASATEVGQGESPHRTRTVLQLMDDVLENPALWLKTSNPQLGDRPPIDLIGTEEEYKVFNLLNAVDQGLF